jgi:hypothetical protein
MESCAMQDPVIRVREKGMKTIGTTLFGLGPGIGEGGFIGAQTAASSVAIDADAIGGVVTSAKGPEAGVWAETTDLPTKFRKIVVTDDASCYVISDLPEAKYKIWVRGYGLVDSEPVQATRGQKLALKALVAPDAKAAAQYYPSDYWLSLMKIPPKSEFPMKFTMPGA